MLLESHHLDYSTLNIIGIVSWIAMTHIERGIECTEDNPIVVVNMYCTGILRHIDRSNMN